MPEFEGPATPSPAGDKSPDRKPQALPALSCEELVQLIGNSTRTMVWSWEVKPNRIVTHELFEEVFGPIPSDFPGALAWWKEHVHPDDRSRLLTAFESGFLSDASTINFEYSIRDKNGEFRAVDDRVTISRDADGFPVRIIGAARDISEKKHAEATRARLARILEATPDIVAMFTIEGTLTHLNLAGRRLLKLPPEQPLGEHRFEELYPTWAMEIVRYEGIPVALSTGVWEGETVVIDPDGREHPVSQIILAHPRPDGSVECLSTIMRDISERKQEEVARIEWANRYDAAIRASGQLLIDWNSFTNELTYGGSTEQFFGYDATGMSGGLNRLRELIHPEDLEAFDREIRRVTETRNPFFLEFRLRRRDGRVIFVQGKGYFFLDREGRLSRMVGFLADVSAQNEAQEELERVHESLEARVAERTTELARAYIVIQDRALQQEAVAHLGQQALAGVRLERLLDEACALVSTILKVDLVSVLELTSDGSELVPIATTGWPRESLANHLSVGPSSQSGYT
ncbi:MAG: PAS domain S-box protein, partial [Verrucomicrobiaceae bacterium]